MKGSVIVGPVAKECVSTYLFFLVDQLSYAARQADLWPRIAAKAGTVV